MKRNSLVILLALFASSVFSQPSGISTAGQPPKTDRPAAPAIQAVLSVSGSLAFVDDRPAIKTTDGKTLFLEMPRFYYYAYTEGFKAGTQVKARGILISAPEGSLEPGQNILVAEEVVIGGKTYIIVAGPQVRPNFRPPMGPPPSGSGPSGEDSVKR